MGRKVSANVKSMCESVYEVFYKFLIRVVCQAVREVGDIYRGGNIYSEGLWWFKV